jgi:hypothetical protein
MPKFLLVPIIVVAMGYVVISLVRGIAAFLQGTRDDLESPQGSGPTASQLRQNEMMFARIKYQALAIIVVAVLLAASK